MCSRASLGWGSVQLESPGDMLDRLRCGIIVTTAFQEWLAVWHAREAAANFGFLPELDYVRCAAGPRAGQSWVTVFWRPLSGVQEHEIFVIGEIKIFIGKQARNGLKERCVDIASGALVVV